MPDIFTFQELSVSKRFECPSALENRNKISKYSPSTANELAPVQIVGVVNDPVLSREVNFNFFGLSAGSRLNNHLLTYSSPVRFRHASVSVTDPCSSWSLKVAEIQGGWPAGAVSPPTTWT